MNLSVTLLMMATLGAADVTRNETFDSYSKAYWTASDQHRPMLVILNPAGSDAVPDVPQTDAASILDDYVVAVIDTGTDHGRQVYELFGSPTLPQTVVIDDEQKKQIFRTSQQLEPETLSAVLKQYRHGVPQTVTAARPITGEPAISQPVISSQPIISQPPVYSYGPSLNSYPPAAGTCPNCRKF